MITVIKQVEVSGLFQLAVIDTRRGQKFAVLQFGEDGWVQDFASRSPHDTLRVWRKRTKRSGALELSQAILELSPSAQERAKGVIQKAARATERKREATARFEQKRRHGKKGATAFYSSWEWKEARFKAIKRYGQQCMCCGFKPSARSDNYLVVDHIKPRSKHPHLALSQENLQVLCNSCNMGKSDKHTDDFR